MAIGKKNSLKEIRRHRNAVSKAPVFVSVSIGDAHGLVGLHTRRPALMGLQSIVTMRGDFRPYLRYLEGTDLMDMAHDWSLVGNDIRVAMNGLKR